MEYKEIAAPAACSELIRETIAMCLLAVLEGQSLSVFFGICSLILGVVFFVWGQWVWERHTIVGKVFVFLVSACLLAAGLMFLGVVNYLDRIWGI